MSINVIGSHLAEHSPTQTKAEGMRQRLALVNDKWDNVCEQATLWQTRLQTALLEVRGQYSCVMGFGIRSMYLNMNRIPADTKKCELNQ